LKFCPLAEERGSLQGVRERGFKGQGSRGKGTKLRIQFSVPSVKCSC
jgi:hypothetical protein